MPDAKPKHKYDLAVVVWEDGEGVVCFDTGWVIVEDQNVVILCAHLSRVNGGGEWVTDKHTEIPVANIHTKEIIQRKWA